VVIGTASTAHKLAVVGRPLNGGGGGADYCVNYTDADWVQQVQNILRDLGKGSGKGSGSGSGSGSGGKGGGDGGDGGSGGGGGGGSDGRRIKKTPPRVVDVAFDPVGLATETSKLMGYHSRLLVLGFTGWNNQAATAAAAREGRRVALPTFDVNRLLVKHCSLIGIYFYAFVDQQPELATRMWEEV
jgi:hypothetical protein